MFSVSLYTTAFWFHSLLIHAHSLPFDLWETHRSERRLTWWRPSDSYLWHSFSTLTRKSANKGENFFLNMEWLSSNHWTETSGLFWQNKISNRHREELWKIKLINEDKQFKLKKKIFSEKKNIQKNSTSPFVLRNSEPTADWLVGSRAESPLAEHEGRG